MAKDKTSGSGPGPVIILVDPQMGENIGAAARAMLNFGLTRLRLVRPRDGWPNPQAVAMASGAAPVVDGARVFDSVEAATADCHFVLATTARPREALLPVFEPKAAAQDLRQRIDAEGQTCAILFGGERSGLDGDDVAKAQGILTVPVNPGFSSLNLAQAVLLIAYEWGGSGSAVKGFATRPEVAPARIEAVNALIGRLMRELENSGYFYPSEKRPLMERNLRIALQRAAFADSEVQTLHGVIKALVHGRGQTLKK
jgi:tRNA/rRNA methyltransferase